MRRMMATHRISVSIDNSILNTCRCSYDSYHNIKIDQQQVKVILLEITSRSYIEYDHCIHSLDASFTAFLVSMMAPSSRRIRQLSRWPWLAAWRSGVDWSWPLNNERKYDDSYNRTVSSINYYLRWINTIIVGRKDDPRQRCHDTNDKQSQP